MFAGLLKTILILLSLHDTISAWTTSHSNLVLVENLGGCLLTPVSGGKEVRL